MIELMLASGNAHKASELAELFDNPKISVVAAHDKIEVVEDGDSYRENALKKAEAYWKRYKKPVISDDSGLNVNFLPDELGIHSARFGGDGLDDRDRLNLLLEKMADVPDDQRGAYFTCYLCVYLGPQEIFFFEGRVKGKISLEARGSAGFGYDPIFMPLAFEGKNSMAEVPEWKKINSHRANAVKSAQEFLAKGSFLS